MLNLPKKTLNKIKKMLLVNQKNVDEQLKVIEKDDPVFDNAIESTEPGTESWTAEVHGRITALKNDLFSLSKKIKDSLQRIGKGTYGKCENCGKIIESKRLEAMPTATLCMNCSKKAPSRKFTRKT